MGRAKQKMIEDEEYEWTETLVAFTCPECGKLSDGSAEAPKIVDIDDYELNVDIEVQCIWCNDIFSAEFSKNQTGFKLIFDDYPETLGKVDPVYFDNYSDDDWYEEPFFYDQPKKPLPVFQEAYLELIDSIRLHAVDDGNSSMNRMFFSQSFSIFEAYLCDTYLNLVFLNHDNKKLFINKHKGVNDISLSLSELMKNSELVVSEIVRKKLTQVIKGTLFHNLDKAMALFKFYQIDLFSRDEEKKLLFKAVKYRHHAVHRNGCDLDGNKLDVYSKSYIVEIAETMMEVTKRVKYHIDSL